VVVVQQQAPPPVIVQTTTTTVIQIVAPPTGIQIFPMVRNFRVGQNMFARSGVLNVVDADFDERIFIVKPSLFAIPEETRIEDIFGNLFLRINAEWSSMPAFMIRNSQGKVVAELKQKFSWTGHESFKINVFTGGPDLHVEGHWYDCDYTIKCGPMVVAQVSTAWYKWDEDYCVRINTGADAALCMAAAVIIERLAHECHNKKYLPPRNNIIFIRAHRPAPIIIIEFDLHRARERHDVWRREYHPPPGVPCGAHLIQGGEHWRHEEHRREEQQRHANQMAAGSARPAAAPAPQQASCASRCPSTGVSCTCSFPSTSVSCSSDSAGQASAASLPSTCATASQGSTCSQAESCQGCTTCSRHSSCGPSSQACRWWWRSQALRGRRLLLTLRSSSLFISLVQCLSIRS